MAKRILLVEDEKHLSETIKLNLELEDYAVSVAEDGRKALEIFKEQHFDLVVLDIMIPQLDGIAVCETIRLTNKETPILFLSAKSAAEDRVLGLKKGGDDYLTKPFNLEELLIRVQKLIDRGDGNTVASTSGDLFIFGNNKINFQSYEATGVDGDFILTKKEALLLKLLIDNSNEVVSREKILKVVWGYTVYPSTRTIDNFILSFRKYFEKDPHNPAHFKSIRGVGYKFMG
jgi:two-component system, OmpR family, alkaline phosphatase synthesis response regulator PhoP